MSTTRQMTVASLTIAIVVGLMWVPTAHAACTGPPPEVTQVDFESAPDCLELQTEVVESAGDAVLHIRNTCDGQATVEMVNCSECEGAAVTVEAGDEASLAVPSAPGDPIDTDYRWAVADADGVVSVTTETGEFEGECNDMVESEDGCSTTGRGAPLSWLLLFAFGITCVLAQRFRRARALRR